MFAGRGSPASTSRRTSAPDGRGGQRPLADFAKLRAVPLDNAVLAAWRFATTAADDERAARRDTAVGFKPDRHASRPATDDDLAFAPLATLASLLRARKVSSVELTRLYLARLRRFDPLLECVVTLTEKLALEQAERADREIAGGHWRGPLHGVPWGAKDLIAVAGYPTTWGSKPYKDQVRPETATVARRLDEAGAVLVAKLALGELAMGDVWFGGQTRNPWNPAEGSCGSSAGPASATAAGLVGFAVGSETLGSIVSPCTRCGATGLRPTFGASPGTARWRCRGRWTSSGRSPARSRTARWCSRRSTAPTGSTRPRWTARSAGRWNATPGPCASVTSRRRSRRTAPRTSKRKRTGRACASGRRSTGARSRRCATSASRWRRSSSRPTCRSTRCASSCRRKRPPRSTS